MPYLVMRRHDRRCAGRARARARARRKEGATHQLAGGVAAVLALVIENAADQLRLAARNRMVDDAAAGIGRTSALTHAWLVGGVLHTLRL